MCWCVCGCGYVCFVDLGVIVHVGVCVGGGCG